MAANGRASWADPGLQVCSSGSIWHAPGPVCILYGPLRLPGAMKLRSGADTAAAGKAIAKQRQHKKLQRSQANHANQQQADARAGRIARWVIANPGKTAADCPFARRGAPPER